MTYRSTTYESDTFPENVRLVSHDDMEFILEYLSLEGCPSISVDEAGGWVVAQRPPPV